MTFYSILRYLLKKLSEIFLWNGPGVSDITYLEHLAINWQYVLMLKIKLSYYRAFKQYTESGDERE
ncbi:hypothetical protein AVV41_gp133 [Microcystis phage MaMV-DC]|uniref:Uncharacterized protein n=1 Tax=Microcystis phage MaMV-DC TaxID=1357715 RepID=A0A075BSQ6_9CAUD|nr:hypothetical protein AVV41_gp133 [Microcystis phage MaMV-DC]AGR48698.1 hypothetical protein MaMVDC_133 [Microcystis phage MaMV-DC]